MALRRSAVVTVGAVAATIAVIAIASDDDYDHAAVCVDQTTQERVDDDVCDDDHRSGFHGGGAGWYYIARGSQAPAIGQRAVGGAWSAPGGDSYSAGFDRSGGVVTRGGFSGSSSHSFGG